jgi:hypothetical protein
VSPEPARWATEGDTSVAPASAPSISAPVSLDIDLGGDDDLPAVGKVWEADSGPSLSELLKQQRTTTAATPAPDPQPAPAAPDSNLAPLSTIDVKKLWPMLVSNLQKESQALSALNLARLDRIAGGVAYIRFGPNGATFARMWQNNGKRDLIGRVLSSMLNTPTGVVFEVDESEVAPDASVGSAPTPAPDPAPAKPAPRRPQPEPAREPVPQDTRTTIPVTPDLVAQLRNDPLVAAVLDELSGQVVRVVEQ